MSNLPSHWNSGIIAQKSGAAVAALKARAATLDAPLIEDSGQLRLLLWGGEMRLTTLAGAMRIDLTAPEKRLVGVLRDCAAELFAEVGLSVDWHDLEIGALAPGVALMRVVSVAEVTPNFLRVRLSGPEAARFATGSLHFRLLLPPKGRAPVWPRVSASGRTIWPEGADALHRPVYTVLRQDQDWLDFDIFRHPGSPTCIWAEGDPVGHDIAILGPGGGGCPEAARLSLFGDETALPAIARMLTLSRGKPAGAVTATLRCAAADLGALRDDPRVRRSDDLLGAIDTLPPAGDGRTIWFAADKTTVQTARTRLLAMGWPRRDVLTAAYWS